MGAVRSPLSRSVGEPPRSCSVASATAIRSLATGWRAIACIATTGGEWPTALLAFSLLFIDGAAKLFDLSESLGHPALERARTTHCQMSALTLDAITENHELSPS